MIWITGAKGMLGRQLSIDLSRAGHLHIGTGTEVNIEESEVINDFLNTHKIDWIVNCAAYTAVDKAEEEKERAAAVNTFAVENLAKAAAKHGCRVIHISTDYVFPGNEDKELGEEDSIGPLSVYGKTKLDGERILRKLLNEHYIIRTSWLYGHYGKNFVATMLKLMSEKEQINVVNDQWGSPTNASDLANAIVHIIEKNPNAYGIYHYSGDEKTCWYDYAIEIYDQSRDLGLVRNRCLINPIPTDMYPTNATRPQYSFLSKAKIKRIFPDIIIPNWRESLKWYLQEVNEMRIPSAQG